MGDLSLSSARKAQAGKPSAMELDLGLGSARKAPAGKPSAMELDMDLSSARKAKKKSRTPQAKPSRSVSLGALRPMAEPSSKLSFSSKALPPLGSSAWTLGPLMFGTPRQSSQGMVWSMGSARKRHNSAGAVF